MGTHDGYDGITKEDELEILLRLNRKDPKGNWRKNQDKYGIDVLSDRFTELELEGTDEEHWSPTNVLPNNWGKLPEIGGGTIPVRKIKYFDKEDNFRRLWLKFNHALTFGVLCEGKLIVSQYNNKHVITFETNKVGWSNDFIKLPWTWLKFDTIDNLIDRIIIIGKRHQKKMIGVKHENSK